jgi:GT2 family glycosyltransferase
VSIDVVVPVHGNWAVTASCLAHLERQSVEHRVIVVDDASPDDTLARLRAEYPDVSVVAFAENQGFAAACNAGIAAGAADVVVLVNNDVDAEPDMLGLLVAPFRDNPILGSAAPLLLRPNGTVDALGLCADKTVAGFVRHAGEHPGALSTKAPTLLGPYGAVAAYRRAAIDDVGGLDEGIFMYGEELDLALRLNAAGWATVAVPAARGTHLGGASSRRGSKSQRRRAGFGRGYLLRAYGILRGRHVVRALATELIVCAGDLVLSRDLASLTGRLSGWHAGRLAARRPRVIPGIDSSIGFLTSLRLRVADRKPR